MPRSLGILVFALSLFSACGLGDVGTEVQVGVSPSAHQLSDVKLASDQVVQLMSASPSQAAAAEDSILTFSEYETVVLEGINCYEKLGYRSRYGLLLTAYGYYYLEFMPTAMVDLDASKDTCRSLLYPTTEIWGREKVANVKSAVPDALLTQAREFLWSCMAEAGTDLRGHAPGLDAAQAIISSGEPEDLAALRTCQEAVLFEFGLPNWIG